MKSFQKGSADGSELHIIIYTVCPKFTDIKKVQIKVYFSTFLPIILANFWKNDHAGCW